MKKTFLYLIFCILITSYTYAQPAKTPKDTTWRIGGYGSLQFSQVALDHWAAGGESSLSLTAIANGFAQYKLGKNYWNTVGYFAYGAISSQYDKILRKNVDRLEVGTRAGHELWSHFFLTALVNFQSQFANGYNYPNVDTVISKFMAPGVPDCIHRDSNGSQ
jgi:hypothetical protein